LISTTISTTFRTGGQPDRSVVFESGADYVAKRASLGPHRVVGGGSNLLLSDSGPQGTLVAVASARHGVLEISGSTALIDAAGDWNATAFELAGQGLAGAESLVGIPGSVGGAIVQNIGAYGHEISEVVKRVRVLSVEDGQTMWLDAHDCQFGYRDSRFKSSDRGQFVVLEAQLVLTEGGLHRPAYAELADELASRNNSPAPEGYELQAVHQAVIALRSAKNMVWQDSDTSTWGAGSFFVNPIVSGKDHERLTKELSSAMPAWPQLEGRVKLSAGWLVEAAGFHRGHSWETVALADGHALGLVNRSGKATTAEVLEAANQIASAVTALTGLRLLAEPILMGFEPDLAVAFDAHIEP